MKMEIKVITQAKHNAISQDGEGLKVHLIAPAVDGKANQALIALLAEHFLVKKRQIRIIKGLHSRHKTISIENVF